MATYQYKARTPEGMAVKGVVQAATVLEAANKVRQALEAALEPIPDPG